MAHLAEQQAAALSEVELDDPRAAIEVAVEAARKHELFVRVLARALLDGEPPSAFQTSFPTVQKIIGALEGAGLDKARAHVAQGLAASLGSPGTLVHD